MIKLILPVFFKLAKISLCKYWQEVWPNTIIAAKKFVYTPKNFRLYETNIDKILTFFCSWKEETSSTPLILDQAIVYTGPVSLFMTDDGTILT